MPLFEEIRRRNVHRVALAYVAGAWLVVQVAETMLPVFGFDLEAMRIVVLALAIGFVPALILSWKFEWTTSGLVLDANVAPAQRGRSSRTLDRAITVFLVIAVAYFAVDKFILSGPVASGQKSIAVLPLRDISGGAAQSFLGSGVAVELTNLLATIPELLVIGTTTTETFAGKDVDIGAAARKMDVSHILTGSVQRVADRVRVAVRLVDAEEDIQLWSEVYERKTDDIFAIQDDIAARVVGQLRLELSDEAPTSEQINPIAYDLYLRGHHLSHVVRTQEAFVEAVDLLERAVELEPAYVPALWSLARSLNNLDVDKDPMARDAVAKRVRSLVDRMVELAPDSSYANGWLWYLARQDGEDLQTQLGHLERAVAGGNDTNVYLQQTFAARALARLGRVDEAFALLEYVLRRDPASGIGAYNIAMLMRQEGRHREAAERLESMLQWHQPAPSTLWSLGVTWLVAGEPEKALAYFEQAPYRSVNMGRLLALHSLGSQDEFAAGLEEFRAAMGGTHPENVARLYAWSGQNDMAFEWLEKLVDQDGPEAAQLVDTDLYEPIKSDPRWKLFLERNGVTEETTPDIDFNPPLPPEVVAEVERLRAKRAQAAD